MEKISGELGEDAVSAFRENIKDERRKEIAVSAGRSSRRSVRRAVESADREAGSSMGRSGWLMGASGRSMVRIHIGEGDAWGRRSYAETFVVSEGEDATVPSEESGPENEAVRQALHNADTFLVNTLFRREQSGDDRRADSTQERHGTAKGIGCKQGAVIITPGAYRKLIAWPGTNGETKRHGEVVSGSSTGVEMGVHRPRRVGIRRVPQEGADPDLMGGLNSDNRGIGEVSVGAREERREEARDDGREVSEDVFPGFLTTPRASPHSEQSGASVGVEGSLSRRGHVREGLRSGGG